MSTDAKRAGNARYLSKFKTLTIRVLPEEADAIAEAAAAAEQSVQGYILQATREKMAGPAQGLGQDLDQAAQAAAKAAGETVPAFLLRAIRETAERDKLAAALKRK